MGWCLSQTTLDEITAENGFSLHPFLKTKTPGNFTEPNNTPSNPTSRLSKYDTIMETTHTAAIPIKPKDLLEWTDNNKCQNCPTKTPIESLDSHKEKIRTINEDIRTKAKQGLEESSKQAYLASKQLEALQTDEYPDLLNYAASPHGMERFMKTQIDNNLAQFLDKISTVQLVFYTTIEEIENDLIPSNLHPYYRKFAEIMEDKEFRTFAWTFPPIGLPPSSAWDNTETPPSPLKTPDGLPIPKILALATAPMLRDGATEIYKPENTILRHEIYAILTLFWEAFSLHTKHWGWALRDYFQVETLLSPTRPTTTTCNKPNADYSPESFNLVKNELESRRERGRYVTIHGSPFSSAMTAIAKPQGPTPKLIETSKEDEA